jgi:hypothetical protein
VKPWDSKVIARGIEFGSSPFDEGLRKSVERGSFLGTPSITTLSIDETEGG